MPYPHRDRFGYDPNHREAYEWGTVRGEETMFPTGVHRSQRGRYEPFGWMDSRAHHRWEDINYHTTPWAFTNTNPGGRLHDFEHPRDDERWWNAPSMSSAPSHSRPYYTEDGWEGPSGGTFGTFKLRDDGREPRYEELPSSYYINRDDYDRPNYLSGPMGGAYDGLAAGDQPRDRYGDPRWDRSLMMSEPEWNDVYDPEFDGLI
ncbi:hypothetical protein LTR56_022954 [Elasticomyces elasticus]|nr:hypothetical protein LTR56_022954 [Elasticomyces elasticus]KAK3626985.1 hypothetical protein LTR22_022942 [Elasticomyces elasticus]KAK4910828.1 hypothetical protein LTR49_020523 [Elasticomyces elasticus]KAK5750405.1 hypothetical protein LTS12_019513 [Elasticomyces elasticus]